MNKYIMATTILSAMLSANAALAETSNEDKYEKCYGVAKSGKNDCATKDGSSSCAGRSVKDADATRWIYVPKGLCDKLVNGVKG